MLMRYAFSIALAGLLWIPTTSQAQISVYNDITAEDLVNQIFSGGVLSDISNVEINGLSGDSIHPYLGSFMGGLSDSVGFDYGLLLGTQHVVNLDPDTNVYLVGSFYGDIDINQLTDGNSTTCGILEFDVVVYADFLVFRYVFASTEYQSFTCSSFNDTFGFFVSGPGIDGPFSNNAINIATIPNSDVHVGINTVNRGAPSYNYDPLVCLEANPNFVQDSIYYVENANNMANNMASTMDVSGYTVPLEALVPVEFGETYHFKLAICNIWDQGFPSFVLLEAGSFQGILASDLTEAEVAGAMKVYPNPAVHDLILDNVCMECEENARVEITDLQGRTLSIQEISTREAAQISIDDLAAGTYLLTVWDGPRRVNSARFVRAAQR